MSEPSANRSAIRQSVGRLVSSQQNEARRILGELLAMRGLIPLLMKSRNGGQWTAAEKTELLARLRRLSRISPYLLLLLLPGSALLLPLYAWWLDRRRHLRTSDPTPSSVPDSQRP